MIEISRVDEEVVNNVDRLFLGDRRFFAIKARLITKEEEDLLTKLAYDDWTFSTKDNYQDCTEELSYKEFQTVLHMLKEWEDDRLKKLDRLVKEIDILKEVLKDELGESCKYN